MLSCRPSSLPRCRIIFAAAMIDAPPTHYRCCCGGGTNGKSGLRLHRGWEKTPRRTIYRRTAPRGPKSIGLKLLDRHTIVNCCPSSVMMKGSDCLSPLCLKSSLSMCFWSFLWSCASLLSEGFSNYFGVIILHQKIQGNILGTAKMHKDSVRMNAASMIFAVS